MMKRFNIMPIFVVGILVVSCVKEDFSKVLEKSLSLEGRYDCISADWYGNSSVDLDNDGQKSSNLLDEFNEMSNSMLALGNNAMVVTGVEDTRHNGCLSIRFPMQYLRRNHFDGKISFANPLGSTAWYEIYYSINTDGEIIWQEPDSISNPEEYVTDEGHYCDGIDFLKTGGAYVRYIIDGTICILFDITYYDWFSESWVSGKVEARYRRRTPLIYV